MKTFKGIDMSSESGRVLTFGVFDYFHLGHLRLFKQCREHGDYLIVAVQDQDYILRYKPEAILRYNTIERVEMLSAIRIVDEVLVYQSVCPEFLETVEFDVLALGEDHKGARFDAVTQWCNEHGKQVVRLKRTPGISSTQMKADRS